MELDTKSLKLRPTFSKSVERITSSAHDNYDHILKNDENFDTNYELKEHDLLNPFDLNFIYQSCHTVERKRKELFR